MPGPRLGAGSGERESVMGRWRTGSLQAGWRVPGDWLTPEVTAVVESWPDAGGLREPARLLGGCRAHHGVGIAEAMTDFLMFFDALNAPVDQESLREFVVGWVESNEQGQPSSCTDVLTGLSTPAHFSRLLYEAATAGTSGDRVVGAIGFVRGPGKHQPAWSLLAEIGTTAMAALPGVAMTYLPRARVLLFFMAATPVDYTRAARCQAALQALRHGILGPATMSFRQAPATDHEFLEFSSTLGEAEKESYF